MGFSENVFYDGIPEVLQQLSDRGARLGLCTSKRVDFAEQILSMFGFRGYFSFVSGGEIGLHKAEQLRQLLANGTIDERAVMIGDRAIDVHAAKSNALSSIAVLWGHGDLDELQAAGPDRILSSVSDLLSLAP